MNLVIDYPDSASSGHMMDVSYYVPNGEWDLVGKSLSITVADRVVELSDWAQTFRFTF